MPNPIDWAPIDSKVLQLASYSARRRWLYLEFQREETYRCFDFPPQQYRAFLAAESNGAYLGKHIRNNFRYEHLPRSGALRAKQYLCYRRCCAGPFPQA